MNLFIEVSERGAVFMSLDKSVQLYRKRYIPAECILLKDDEIVDITDDFILTKWRTLHPKPGFSHGCSCYYLNKGWKISKFYAADNTLLYYYCDITDYSYDEKTNSLTVTDLLADVLVYPDGTVKVVDLEELADCLEQGTITDKELCLSLRRLDELVNIIYAGNFDTLTDPMKDL